MLTPKYHPDEFKKAALKRGLRVLSGMSLGTEEDDCIYDGGMATLECYMEVLGLVPASESKWYKVPSGVSLDSTLKHMERMFIIAEKLKYCKHLSVA